MTEKPEDYKAIIYCITCIPTGLKYIGQTYTYKYNVKKDKWYSRTIEHRFKEHIADKDIHNRPLHRDIKEHGSNNFEIQELEKCNEEDSSKREHYWIKTLNTIIPNGYNKQLFSRRVGASMTEIGTPEYAEIKGIKENNILTKVRVLIKYEEYDDKIRHMFHENTYENTITKATDECLKILDRSKIIFHHSLYGTVLSPLEQYKEKLSRLNDKIVTKMHLSLFENNTVLLYIRTKDMKKYSDQVVLNFGGPKTDVTQSLDRAKIVIDKYINDSFSVTYGDRLKEILG